VGHAGGRPCGLHGILKVRCGYGLTAFSQVFRENFGAGSFPSGGKLVGIGWDGAGWMWMLWKERIGTVGGNQMGCWEMVIHSKGMG